MVFSNKYIKFSIFTLFSSIYRTHQKNYMRSLHLPKRLSSSMHLLYSQSTSSQLSHLSFFNFTFQLSPCFPNTYYVRYLFGKAYKSVEIFSHCSWVLSFIHSGSRSLPLQDVLVLLFAVTFHNISSFWDNCTDFIWQCLYPVWSKYRGWSNDP